MSAHDEGTEGSSSMSRPSSVDPNIYVLSEAIRSSMENSMELLSATMQRNALVMANTIREGFAARPSIEGSHNTLSKKRACTSLQVACDDSSGSSHKCSRNMAREACTAQVVVASPSHSEGDRGADVVSLLDPSDSFSDPEQPVATPSTLDRALADFEVEETTWPPLSEAMALWVCHILKTLLMPEKLKLHVDRELCPIPPWYPRRRSINRCLISVEGLWQLFRGMTSSSNRSRRSWPGPCSHLYECLTVSSWQRWRHLLCLALQKPWMPVWTASACSPVQTCRWTRCAEGFKAALPTRYKGLVNVPDPPTELLFRDLGASLMCILKGNPWNMSGSLSNLGYGWGPLTSGMHITVFVWILPSISILPVIGRGAIMSFDVCLMGMLRHPSYSPSCWSSHFVSFGNMVMLQLST